MFLSCLSWCKTLQWLLIGFSSKNWYSLLSLSEFIFPRKETPGQKEKCQRLVEGSTCEGWEEESSLGWEHQTVVLIWHLCKGKGRKEDWEGSAEVSRVALRKSWPGHWGAWGRRLTFGSVLCWTEMSPLLSPCHAQTLPGRISGRRGLSVNPKAWQLEAVS